MSADRLGARGADPVDRLQVAWRFPISASGGYGAVTANPLILGETVFLQNMESNAYLGGEVSKIATPIP